MSQHTHTHTHTHSLCSPWLMFFSKNTTSYGLEEFLCIHLHKSSSDFFTSLTQNSHTFTTNAIRHNGSESRSEKVWGEVGVGIHLQYFAWFADNISSWSENFVWEESAISCPFCKLHVLTISHYSSENVTSTNSIPYQLFIVWWTPGAPSYYTGYLLVLSSILNVFNTYFTKFLPLSSTEAEVRMWYLQSQSLHCIRFIHNVTNTCREKLLDTHKT